MEATKGTLLLTLAGVLIVTVVHAQGLQLAITDEQLREAARDAASPPVEWVFGDVMTRRRVRGDYRTAGGGYVFDLRTFTSIQQFPLSAFADLPLDVICVGRNGNEPFRIDVADLDALTFQR